MTNDREDNLHYMLQETALNTIDVSEETCGTALKTMANVKKYVKSSQWPTNLLHHCS